MLPVNPQITVPFIHLVHGLIVVAVRPIMSPEFYFIWKIELNNLFGSNISFSHSKSSYAVYIFLLFQVVCVILISCIENFEKPFKISSICYTNALFRYLYVKFHNTLSGRYTQNEK